MNQKEENLLARLHNVGGFLKRNAGVVAGVAALAAAVGAYAAYLSKVPSAPESDVDADTATNRKAGAKQAKDAARTALAAPAQAMFNALRLHYQFQYTTTGDVEHQKAAAEMTVKRPAELRRGMPTGQLQRLLDRAVALLDALPAGALAAYNHDDAKIAKFKTLASQFGSVAGAPRAARDEAKGLGEQVSDTLRAARDYVKNELAPAVGLLADDNSEFVKGFKQANKQDDRRGGQSSRPAQPDQPA